VPEPSSLLQQVLSLAKEGHPLSTAAPMVESEMDSAAGWGPSAAYLAQQNEKC